MKGYQENAGRMQNTPGAGGAARIHERATLASGLPRSEKPSC